MVISVPPEIEHALIEAAQQQGPSPALLALTSLQERFVKPGTAESVPATGETLFGFL